MPDTHVHSTISLREHISALLRGQTEIIDCEQNNIDKVVELASKHGVTALLYAALDGRAEHDVYTDSLCDALKPKAFQQAACAAIVEREIKQIVSQLDKNGIKFLLLKGTPLAYTLYSEAHLRPRVDTDLLIVQDDRARIKLLLSKLGFTPEPGIDGTLATHQFMLSKETEQGLTVTLDIHWKITNPQVFASLLDLDELYRDRQAIQALGPGAYAPSPLHLLTHALIHRIAHHHERERLIWLYDIYLLTEHLDKLSLQKFIALCQTKKISTVCLDGIKEAHNEFGGENLQRLIQLMAKSMATNVNSVEENSTKAFLKPGFDSVDQFRSDWKTCNWSQRLQLLNEHCFPSSSYMHLRYGDAPLPLLYLNRFGNGFKKLLGIN
ncbi:MAG: nucleotidyltransferase family protein [Gammaproteobacteria bacterium]|nr:nucleotidyltransferase family protein [Gammaproteobacteria bacterium]